VEASNKEMEWKVESGKKSLFLAQELFDSRNDKYVLNLCVIFMFFTRLSGQEL